MFKLKSLVVLVAGLLAISSTVHADNQMTPPKPIDNKVYDAMVGTWQGESDMMGTKMRDKIVIKWSLGHQFLTMDLQSVGVKDSHMKYFGMGIFGLDNSNKAVTWWFDNWGAQFVSTGTGDFGNNKLTLNDSNNSFNETRTFEIDGNKMTMHAKGTMKDPQGKDIPFETNTVYMKK